MSEKCIFCSHLLSSEDDIVNHYKQQHRITGENSPALESYVNSLQSDPFEFFIKKYSYYDDEWWWCLIKKVDIIKENLKILNTSQVNNVIVRRIGNWFIELSVDYHHFPRVYDFTKPENIIFDFIEIILHKIPDANGEFCLICCVVNQQQKLREGKFIQVLVLQQVLFKVQWVIGWNIFCT